MDPDASILSFSKQQCRDLLSDLERAWTGFDGQPTTAQVLSKIDTNVASGPGTADSAIRSLTRQVAELYLRLDRLGLLTTDGVFRLRVDRLMKVLGFACLVVTSSHRIQQVLQDNGDPGDLRDSFFSFSSMSSLEQDEEIKTYQRLLLHLTSQAQMHGYRRYMGAVYQARLSDGGHNTHSWTKVCELREFVYSCCRKELFFQQWKWLTEKPHYAANAVTYLTDCEEYQFPRLTKDRSSFSFQNGIYLAAHDRFAPYGGAVDVPHNLCCAKYFEHPLPVEHVGAAGEAWRDIPTPTLDGILASQRFTEDVKGWLYIFIGRLLYNVGQLDNWQVIPYIKGIAGAGKSTIVNDVAGRLYERVDVGQLSNNCERQFGLSAFYDKLLFVAPEIKADFRIEQSGERAYLPHFFLLLPLSPCLLRDCRAGLQGGRGSLHQLEYMPSHDQLEYMGGHMDGDGSVAIVLPSASRRHLGFVWVRITKTVKNPHMLDWFVANFGGKVHNLRPLSRQRPNNSDTLTWQLEHGEALAFCKLLSGHCRLKGRELDLAGRLPVDAIRRSALRGVKLVKGGEELVFESHTAAAAHLKRDPNAVRSAVKRGGLCAGWQALEHQVFTRQQVKQLVEQMYWCLRFMKQMPDEPISKPLSLSYAAGLFDAEGSISITGSDSMTVSISQKDPAVRIALETQFGGRSSGVKWLAPEGGRPFLALIKPYCVEKLAQVDLALAMAGDGPAVKAKLDPLQRNKRKRWWVSPSRMPPGATVPRARRSAAGGSRTPPARSRPGS